jgi:ATP-dependent Clp protease ATP-binding subunit ClpC
MNVLIKLNRAGTNILIYILYLFAIPHHLQTFFAPFKRMTYQDDGPGMSFQRLGEIISFNLVSIGIGIIIRTMVILAGVGCILLALSLIALAHLVVLVLAPVLAPAQAIADKERADRVKNWAARAQAAPGKTLVELLTTTPEGKFIVQKLVLKSEDILPLDATAEFPLKNPANTLPDLFVALATDFTPFNKFLEVRLLDEKDIRRICEWYENLHEHKGINLEDREALTKISGIGADWSYGYTNELNKFQVTQESTQFTRVVGRDEEIGKIEAALSRSTQNSCLVVGEPGVGRHAVIDEFARRLYAGKVDQTLVGHRTIYLDLKSAIAGQGNIAASRKQALDLLEEGRQAGNIILVIDDIDKFFETSGERMDLTDIFVQTLSDGRLRVIGLTSEQLYDKLFAGSGNLLKLFTPVKITAPDIETVYKEMELSIVPVLERTHKVEISYSGIKEAITNADRFISTIPFPEKAVNIMDETVSYIKTEHPHMRSLWKEDVDKYLSEKTKIPMGTLSQTDSARLTNLETIIHDRIVGQNEAVTALARAMRRSVLSVSARNKPVGTFLFLGPTGVGKTETAKALAEAYFGNENRMLRFDMSEFQGEEGMEKLIGNAASNRPGQLTSAIADSPFSVLLLDEIEKSPPLILNLFLTLLDEGYITDIQNRKISARQNIIIGTSNAGALFIRDQVEQGVAGESLRQNLINYILEQKIFSPEFINRFDGVIVFEPLSRDQIRTVARKMLEALNKRLGEKKIALAISDTLVDRLVAEGYDPVFGARAMRRYIQDQVEDEVAQILLSGKVQPGTTIEI